MLGIFGCGMVIITGEYTVIDKLMHFIISYWKVALGDNLSITVTALYVEGFGGFFLHQVKLSLNFIVFDGLHVYMKKTL